MVNRPALRPTIYRRSAPRLGLAAALARAGRAPVSSPLNEGPEDERMSDQQWWRDRRRNETGGAERPWIEQQAGTSLECEDEVGSVPDVEQPAEPRWPVADCPC